MSPRLTRQARIQPQSDQRQLQACVCAISHVWHPKSCSLGMGLCCLGARVSYREDAEVLVVGGGPVGLSLAMDLAKRGIRILLA